MQAGMQGHLEPDEHAELEPVPPTTTPLDSTSCHDPRSARNSHSEEGIEDLRYPGRRWSTASGASGASDPVAEEADLSVLADAERLQAARQEGRRGSKEGPSVPVEFREAALAESSRSHEWRQRLLRLVVGNRGAAGSDGSASGNASGHASMNASATASPALLRRGPSSNALVGLAASPAQVRRSDSPTITGALPGGYVP